MVIGAGTSMPWGAAGWRDEVEAWIRSQLAQQGMTVTGAIEQPHVRPWATVLRVPAGGEVVYFKAMAPAMRHEAPLTAALWRWRPDCMPPVVASDADRGWLLLRDMGDMLRARIESPEDGLRQWRQVLPLYAGVQIEMIDRRDEILALGALDRRCSTLPPQYRALLGDTEILRIGQEDGLTAEEYERLRGLTPTFAELCQRLAGYGIPETLHHDDFHDGNVFVSADGSGGRYILADWAEAGIAHPFCTLVVAMRSIAYRLKLDENGPEIAGLREAYLEPWTRFGAHSDLLEACALAQRVGRVARALTWYLAVRPLTGTEREEDRDAVPGWLQIYLEGEGGQRI